MRYDRTIIAYHGCDAEVAERLLAGEPFKRSRNKFDWLGEGIYFWEYGAERALQFAHDQRARGKVRNPAIVGALLQLGNCFDLMDTHFTAELASAFAWCEHAYRMAGVPLPVNSLGPDRLLRRLDCTVLNTYLREMQELGRPYDSVRCGFVEGPPVFEGSAIHRQSHVQVAIRSPACVIGVFRPTMVP